MSHLNFRIESSAKAYEVLASNLYSDKISAVIRELSCNAADAHAEAGIPEIPFEVDLPYDNKCHHFRVRDFGSGLKAEQIEDVFAVFFSSTKVGSKAYTGAFGLGCKSPFAIADNFFVNSYIEGKKYFYHCHKKNGIPAIDFVKEEPTKELNGLEIIVPASASIAKEWHEKAKNIYEFFKVRPKVNVKFSYYNETYSYKFGDNWETSQDSGAWIVMSNVRYPLKMDKIRRDLVNRDFHYKRRGLVYHVPPRSIEVTPSREGISYTPETISFLESFIEKVNNEFLQSIQARIDKQPSKLLAKIDYIQIENEYAEDYFSYDVFLCPSYFTWKGSSLSETSKILMQIDYTEEIEIGFVYKISRYSANSKTVLFTNRNFGGGHEVPSKNIIFLINDSKASQETIKSWANRLFKSHNTSAMTFLIVREEYKRILTEYNKISEKLIRKCSDENLHKLSKVSTRSKIASKNVNLYVYDISEVKIVKDNLTDGEDVISDIVNENGVVYFQEYDKSISGTYINNTLIEYFDGKPVYINDIARLVGSINTLSEAIGKPFKFNVNKILLIRCLKKNKLFLKRYAKDNKIKFISFQSYYKKCFLNYVQNNQDYIKSVFNKIFLDMIKSGDNDFLNLNFNPLSVNVSEICEKLNYFIEKIEEFKKYKDESDLIKSMCNFIESNNYKEKEKLIYLSYDYICRVFMRENTEEEIKTFISQYSAEITNFAQSFIEFCENNSLIFAPYEEKQNKIIEYCLTSKMA